MFVLVVDDDPIARMTHLAMLAKLPEVRAVGSASVAEARRVIAAQQPDAALVDMQLPDGTGLEIISLLEQSGPSALVLVVSAQPEPMQPHENPRLHRLAKPVQLKELTRLVRSAPPPDRAAPFSVNDYVQLAAAGAYSARLQCMDPAASGKAAGEILIVDGQLWSACDEQGPGPAALARLAAAGCRIVVTGAPEPEQRPPRNLPPA